jgi:hypothetical protein
MPLNICAGKNVVATVVLATVVTVASVCWADEVEAPAVDPAVLVMPKRPPPFRERITGAEWDKRFAEASAKLGDLDVLAKSSYPEAGCRLDHVWPGSQGEALGLQPGEIISAIDGNAVNQHDLWAFRKKDEQQTITVVDAEGKPRELTIQPGPIGIHGIEIVRPELVYLRHGARDPRWDSHVAVGAAVCMSDPDLAETAWHHALRAGYVDDFISDYCAAQIAWRQGRPEDAEVSCVFLLKRKNIPAALEPDMLAYQLGLANFQIPQALAHRKGADPGKTKEDKGYLDAWLHEILDAHRKLAEPQRRAATPHEVAAYVKTNLLKQMEPHLTGYAGRDDFLRNATETLAKGQEPLELAARTDSFNTMLEMPREEGVQDVELIVRATMRDTDTDANDRDKIFVAGLVSGDTDDHLKHGAMPGGYRLLGIRIDTDGHFWIDQASSGMGTGLIDRGIVLHETTGGRKFTLRFIHCRGRDELWIDRRRLIYLPTTDGAQKVGFMLAVVGVTAEVRVDFARLNPMDVEGK